MRILILVSVLIFTLGVIACEVEPDTTAVPTIPPTPMPVISAEALYAEREANATRFDLDYKGNMVKVTGVVGSIDSGEVRLIVDMESYEILDGLFLDYIALDDLSKDEQATANRGQEFTAICKVGNYIFGTMYLKDCQMP